MGNESAEYRAALRQFLDFHEALVSTHVAKVKREYSPPKDSVRAVLPLWDRLDRPPLRSRAAERMVELLREAMASGDARRATDAVDDCCLIVTVVPACDAADVREFFPDGYAVTTLVEAGAADAVLRGRWVAHWILCTDGTRSPTLHLTVFPPRTLLESSPALMLWAQDLFTRDEWQRLPATIERHLGNGAQRPVHDEGAVLALAHQVAERPETWEAVVTALRDTAAERALPRRLTALVTGHELLNCPEPVGFLAAALWFELAQATGADAAFVCDVGVWACGHPCQDARLVPARRRVHEALMARTDRRDTPQLWAATQQALGNDWLCTLDGNRRDNLRRAVRCFEASLEVFTEATEPVSWAITQHSLGHAYLECADSASSRDLDRAIRCCEASLRVRTRAAMPVEWADSTLGLAACLRKRAAERRTDDEEAALRHHRAVLEVYSATAMPARWATAQDSLATAYLQRLGDDRAENVEAAIRCYREALTVRGREAAPVEWAMSMNNLGTAYNDRVRGDRAENQEEAIRCYRAALSVRAEQVSARQLGIRNHNLGGVYLDRVHGDAAENVEAAIGCYVTALTVRSRTDSPAEWSMTQNDLGHAYTLRQRGDRAENLEHAIRHLTMALAVRTRASVPAAWAQTRNNLGIAYRDRPTGDRAENLATAVACFQDAAETTAALGLRREAVRSYRNLGRVEMVRKNWAAACAALETAAGLLEGELAESHTEVGRLAWLREQSGVYDSVVAAYLLAHQAGLTRVGPGSSSVARACEWAEHSRARALADLTVDAERVPGGVAEETYRAYRSTTHEVRDLDQRLEARERARADQEVANLRERRTVAYGRLLALREQFAAADPDWAPGAKSPSVRAVLDVARESGAALLTLRPTEWGTCVVVALPDGKVAGGVLKSLPLSRVQDLLVRRDDGRIAGGWMVEYDRYRTASEAEDADRRRGWYEELDRTLGHLGEWLWQPLRKLLAQVYPPGDDPNRPRPLVILPGQGLNVLPLHACWWDDAGERRWASDEYRIGYTPSVWVLRRCLARQARFAAPPRALLAVRNPTGDLHWANWEVDGVCRLLPGATVLGRRDDPHPATRLRLMEELPRFPLALVCTHGKYELTDPWSGTGLCTADAERDHPTQPCLSLADISALKLTGLWLAVLSACESGVADHRDPAGEQFGLPSALLAAGAVTAVGSLWVVDDRATALLSRRFFEELFAPEGGEPVSKGLALWRAQRWLRQLTGQELSEASGTLPNAEWSLRDMVRVPRDAAGAPAPRPFEHPVYWSAFACYGAG